MKWTLIIIAGLLSGSCRNGTNKVDVSVIDAELTIKGTGHSCHYLDSLFSLDPDSEFLLGMTAVCRINNNSLEVAEELLDSKSEDGTFTLMALGLLNDRKGNLSAAQDFFDRSILLDKQKNNKWLRLYLFHHYRERNFDKALQFLNDAIQIDPAFNQAIIEKAYLLSPVNDCDSIIRSLENISQQYKDEAYLSFLGDAYYYCNDAQRARECYVRSNMIKKNGFAYFGLGTTEHYLLRNLEKAKEFYNESLNYEETSCNAMISLGWVSFDEGKFSNSESFLKKAVQTCPVHESYNELIFFLIKIGNLKTARDFLIEYEQKLGPTHFIEGFKILIDALVQRVNSEEINKKIDDFHAGFGQDAADWLHGLFNDLKDTPTLDIVPDHNTGGI